MKHAQARSRNASIIDAIKSGISPSDLAAQYDISVGYVYIGTLSENSSIQPNNRNRKDHPDHAAVVYAGLKRTLEQRLSGAGSHTKNSDLPRGVTRNPKCKSYQAQATMRGKSIYLGSFPTVEEARAAYVAAVMADVNSAHQNSEAA